MSSLEELVLKLLDDEITSDELSQLHDLLETEAGQAAFQQHLVLQSHLLESGRESIADRVTARLQSERCRRVEDGVMRAVRDQELPDGRSGNTPSTSPRVAGGLAARVAAVVVAVAVSALIVIWAPWTDSVHPAVARVASHGAIVSVVDQDGQHRLDLRSRTPSVPVLSGQIVQATSALALAEILYEDGTVVELQGKTRVKLAVSPEGGKELFVMSGQIQAFVSPQPAGLPLRIATSTATLEVLGTVLGVEVRDSSTQLQVSSGRVAITRHVDGERVEVSAGQLATATDSSRERLRARPFPKLPDTWEEGFADGLPQGWSTGRLIKVEQGNAVLAVNEGPEFDNDIAIRTQNAWQEGSHALFSLHDDSVLHIRCRQEVAAPIRLMLVTRAYPPAGRSGTNLHYENPAWSDQLADGDWHTLSIPAVDVSYVGRRGVLSTRAPELTGLAVFLIQMSTMEHDVSLIVDRMWVTRKETGDRHE